MSYSARSSKTRAINGRHDGVDSGGRKIDPAPEFDTGMPNKPEDLDKHASCYVGCVCHALKAVEILA